MMTFADLVAGDHVFLDANTLVYHFGPHPTLGAACNQLVHRIENQELSGSTSTHVLSEVAHRLMLFEASNLPGWSLTGVKGRLQKKPAAVQGLTQFRQAEESVLQSRVQVQIIAPALIATAAAVSQQTGLLSSDALIVAIMQASGLTKLASADTDLDHVPGLVRHAPTSEPLVTGRLTGCQLVIVVDRIKENHGAPPASVRFQEKPSGVESRRARRVASSPDAPGRGPPEC
jgi:predicted nucleic acid-binding protein